MMKTRRVMGILAGIVAVILSAGCNLNVGPAAQSSLASFLNTLASTAINNALYGND